VNQIFRCARMLGITFCFSTLLLSYLYPVSGKFVFPFGNHAYEGLLSKTEFVLANVRGSFVMMNAKSVRLRPRNALIIKLCINLTRVANDLVAVYNVLKRHDIACFNYSPALWIVNDVSKTLSDLIDYKKDKALDDYGFILDEDSIELSKNEKFLVEYVLPFAEWIAALTRVQANYESTVEISGGECQLEYIEWISNIVISGSRILSELIKSKAGSTEQKLAILKAVVCASVILFDFHKGNWIAHSVPENS